MKSMLSPWTTVFTDSLQTWFSTHPLIHWVASHPLYDLGLGLVALFLLSGLLKAIARLTERLWLALLQAPFRLGQWLVHRSAQVLRLRTAPPREPQPDRLSEILARLEALRLEQDALLQEAQSLLAQESPLGQRGDRITPNEHRLSPSELAPGSE